VWVVNGAIIIAEYGADPQYPIAALVHAETLLPLALGHLLNRRESDYYTTQ
jgi:hypothetical protein